MSDNKISGLGAASTLGGSEILPIVQSGSTKQIPVFDLVQWRPVSTGIYYENIISPEDDYRALHQSSSFGFPALFSGIMRNAQTEDAMALSNAYSDFIIGDNSVGLSRPAKFITLGESFFGGGTASSVSLNMSPIALDEQNDGFALFSINIRNNPYGNDFGFSLSYDGTLQNSNAIQIGDTQANHQLAAGQLKYDGQFKGYDGTSWNVLGGNQNLSQVLQNGNYTDGHDLVVTTGDRVVTGASRAGLGRGSMDRGIGGDNGVSLYCSVEKELNWQAGWLTNYVGGVPEDINMGSHLSFGSGMSLKDGSFNYSVFPHERQLVNASATPIIDWSTGEMFDGSGYISQDWFDRNLFDHNEAVSVRYDTNRYLVTAMGVNSVAWNDFALQDATGAVVVLDWSDGAKHTGKWSFNNQATSATSTGWTAVTTFTPTKTFSSSLTATTIQVADTLATLLDELRTKGIISA